MNLYFLQEQSVAPSRDVRAIFYLKIDEVMNIKQSSLAMVMRVPHAAHSTGSPPDVTNTYNINSGHRWGSIITVYLKDVEPFF